VHSDYGACLTCEGARVAVTSKDGEVRATPPSEELVVEVKREEEEGASSAGPQEPLEGGERKIIRAGSSSEGEEPKGHMTRMEG